MKDGTYPKSAECDMIYWRGQNVTGIKIRKVREEKLNNGDKSCTGGGG